ncbi:hypothetical protein Tco_1028674 [Tanacetum coccineum]|uniref:Uncharacterized protein n=1 Tax=Tanacetum coccineum TaxID=301880 RepID=A0ABQ5G199_9ASTR
MTTLKFADTHNMVVFLSKPKESDGFEQIVDFLNAHPIKYALTVNPTIYTSCIEQFRATIKAKTVNGEVQLQALVDGKKIVITELTNLEIVSGKFLMYPRNMRRAGKGFSGRETPLFQTMVVQDQEEICEGSAMPTDPHHTPTIIQTSTSQPQRKQRPRKPMRKDTKIPQSSGPIDNVADEAINEEMDDSLEKAATTATSLDAEQDRELYDDNFGHSCFHHVSFFYSLCLIKSRIPTGGDPRRQETMGDTIAQTRSENVFKPSNDPLLARVIDLEKSKTSQAQEITSLKWRVRRLEKKGGSRTHKLKRPYKVGLSARVKSSKESLGEKDASKQRRISNIDADAGISLVSTHFNVDTHMFGVHDLVGDEMIVETEVASKDVNLSVDEVTLAQVLAALKSAKPKANKVLIQEPEQVTPPNGAWTEYMSGGVTS